MTYLKVSTDDFLNTTNKDTYFTEIRKVFEESFYIKIQELSMLKYPNFRIYQSPLGFIIYQTDCIMKLVNEWFPYVKFRKVDTPLQIDSKLEE